MGERTKGAGGGGVGGGGGDGEHIPGKRNGLFGFIGGASAKGHTCSRKDCSCKGLGSGPNRVFRPEGAGKGQ